MLFINGFLQFYMEQAGPRACHKRILHNIKK